jgi:two-component system, LytTR family, sensor kinase
MKRMNYKNILVNILHLLFWMVSINTWYYVFNPGVESATAVQGLTDDWFDFFLINSLFFIYCLLPFIWFAKRTKKWLKILCSIIFLIPVLYFLTVWILPKADKDNLSLVTDFFFSSYMYVIVFHVTIILAVYYNLRVLIHRFLMRSRFGLYLSYFSGLTIIAAVLNYALFNFGFDLLLPGLYFISYFRIWELIIIVAAYLIVTTLLFLIWQYALMLIANKEKAQHELSALKAQINPHFLFNNLNTIYSMASKNDEKTKDVILKLSDFLRFVLYDTSSDTILLEKEVEMIRTYVDLQQERIDPGITPVILDVEGDFGNTRIAPFLLLPFVENCFKHGIGKDPGKIQIDIRLKGKRLLFKTENRVALREKTGNEENGGIGIRNVEKRLNLLYPGRHSLQLEENAGVFRTALSVDLP